MTAKASKATIAAKAIFSNVQAGKSTSFMTLTPNEGAQIHFRLEAGVLAVSGRKELKRELRRSIVLSLPLSQSSMNPAHRKDVYIKVSFGIKMFKMCLH